MNTNSSINANANPVIETAQTMAQGNVPSNQTMVSALDKASASIEAHAQKTYIDPKTERLTEKLQNVVEAAKDFLLEKNADDKLQRMAGHAKEATKATADELKKSPIAGQAKYEFSKLSFNQPDQGAILGFMRQMASSQEFRQTMSQSLFWLRSMFAGIVGTQGSVKEAAKELLQEGEQPSEQAEEARKKAWEDFVRFMRVIGQRPEYRQAVFGFFQLIDGLKQKSAAATTTTSSFSEAQDKIQAHPSTRALLDDARSLLEELAGGKSLDAIYESVRSVYGLMECDDQLTTLFHDIRDLLEKLLRDPAMIDDEAELTHAKEVMKAGWDRAKQYKDSIYLQQSLNRVEEFLQAIKDDPTNAHLAHTVKEFQQELWTQTKSGEMTWNQDAMNSLRGVLMPIMREIFDNIPLPTFEGKTEDGEYDYRFENVTLSARDILPNSVHIHNENDTDFDLEKFNLGHSHHEMRIRIQEMRVHLKDVKFWFKRHSIPRLEDTGIMDVDIGGARGARLEFYANIKLESPRFSISRFRFSLDSVDVTIKESAKHEWLLKMFSALFADTIRSRIEEVVCDRIKDFSIRINQVTNRILDELYEKAQSAKASLPEGQFASAMKEMWMPSTGASTTAPGSSAQQIGGEKGSKQW